LVEDVTAADVGVEANRTAGAGVGEGVDDPLALAMVKVQIE
jgi:hypothetical protein